MAFLYLDLKKLIFTFLTLNRTWQAQKEFIYKRIIRIRFTYQMNENVVVVFFFVWGSAQVILLFFTFFFSERGRKSPNVQVSGIVI